MRIAVVLACVTATAHAEPLVLDAGQLGFDVTLETKIISGKNPTSFAHDFWWGITERLTLGAIHSSRSLDRIDAGAGISLQSAPDRIRRYTNAGIDARYLVASRIALHARLLLREHDPVKPAVTLGANLRFGRRLFVAANPYLQLPLANADRGNRTTLVIPAFAGYETRHAEVAFHTGVDGELVNWRDGWHVPIALRLRTYGIGLEFGFASLLGPQSRLVSFAMLTLGFRT